MVIGVLQFELLVHDCESLKDKRRVVQSVKDRLHRDHMVAVAEVGRLDSLGSALLALVCVGNDGAHLAGVLDRIVAKLRALTDAELGDTRRDLIHGSQLTAEPETDGAGTPDGAITDELLRYAADDPTLGDEPGDDGRRGGHA